MDGPPLWTRRRVLGALGTGAITTAGLRLLGNRLQKDRLGKGLAVAAPTRVPPETVVAPPAEPSDGRPPQFIVISFDGSASTELLTHWRTVAREANARFSFFVSGTYLLLRERAALYHPPRHGAGKSDIGFFPAPGVDPATEMSQWIAQLGDAYREGHEIGTHFNGHFCGKSGRAVGAWNADDWKSEIDQFRSLLTGVAANNELDASPLPFGAADIVGGRTPCLEGDLSVLYPVLAQAGFRYDASDNGPEGAWPARRHGLWSVPLHAIALAGTQRRVLALDYNLYANQSGARSAPLDQVPAIRAQALETFRNYFTASYDGNRAPMAIGNHFARWNSSAYIDALTEFIAEVAPITEVRFVTYRNLVDWLDLRTPADLATFAGYRAPVSRADATRLPG